MLNAVYVWGLARERDGRVLLRIEDHDRERCRPEYESGILEDLDWLGFVPDVRPTGEFRRGACAGRQSDREEVYRQALERLRSDGLVYACECTRRTLTNGAYDGRCRERRLPLRDSLGWRVRIDPGVEAFDDLLLGAQEQDPSAQCGDILIRDRTGNWTYQFAVTVDDWQQGIDTVVRGADLLDSTGRQIRLARLLGRDRPAAYAHHPLIMKSAGQKLSKSDGDSGVRELRARGWTPQMVIDAARRAARVSF